MFQVLTNLVFSFIEAVEDNKGWLYVIAATVLSSGLFLLVDRLID